MSVNTVVVSQKDLFKQTIASLYFTVAGIAQKGAQAILIHLNSWSTKAHVGKSKRTEGSVMD